MPLSIVILAAGQGTRMKSARPKVLHSLAGRPLLAHVIDTARALEPAQLLVVVGHGGGAVREAFADDGIEFVEQREQLGTGHAVQQCVDRLPAGNDLLVLFGDVPLLRAPTLGRMIDSPADAAVCLLAFEAKDPTGYGRVIRDGEQVRAIVEEKDADAAQRAVRECYCGPMLLRGARLAALLGALDNDNAQREYYLPDVVAHAVAAGDRVSAVIAGDASEVGGINDQRQLAEAEAILRTRVTHALMDSGTKLYDPARIEIRGELVVGRDVEIDVNCIFEGRVTLGDDVRIGANCVIRNSTVGAGSEILPMTSIDDSEIGRNVMIGPFARLRPGNDINDGSKIGNFVEIKNTRLGTGSKVSHLSYVGDAEVGESVNIGAGTITCNYDGANKHKTVIEDDVFIGSDTQLVAPVRVARGATVGAGSTITKDVPANRLAVSRARQVTIDNWSKPVKKREE